MKILPWLIFLLFTSGIVTVVFIENKIGEKSKPKTTGRGGDFHE